MGRVDTVARVLLGAEHRARRTYRTDLAAFVSPFVGRLISAVFLSDLLFGFSLDLCRISVKFLLL